MPALSTTRSLPATLPIPIHVVLIPMTVLLLHCFYYYPYRIDDAYISMRYAERLWEGKGLTWNDGEYVEGYSNLSWVLLMTGFKFLGFDAIATSIVLGIVSGMATILAILWYSLRAYKHESHFIAVSVALTFALSGPVAISCISGLETMLAACLVAWVTVLTLCGLDTPTRGRALLIGTILGGLCVTRPEAPLLVMIMGAAWLFAAKCPWRTRLTFAIIFCTIPAIVYLAQLAFRLHYYGEILPNTYYAKVAFTRYRVLNGLLYVAMAVATFMPVILLIAIHIGFSFGKRVSALPRCKIRFLTVILSAWLLAVIIGGGDTFPGCRHVVVIVPVFMLLLAESLSIGIQVGSESGVTGKEKLLLFTVLCCFLCLQFSSQLNPNPAKDPATQRAAQDSRMLGLIMRRQLKACQPYVATLASGEVPYLSALPTLDMLGLNDRTLARVARSKVGYGFPAHEAFDAEYVLGRKPDIIIAGARAEWLMGDLMNKAEFHQQYEATASGGYFEGTGIWVRRDSAKVELVLHETVWPVRCRHP